MKAKDLRAKTAAELTTELDSLLRAQFSLRMQKATAQLNKTSEIGKIRKDIARVKTLLTEKSRAA